MIDTDTLSKELRGTQDRVLILEQTARNVERALNRIFDKLTEIGEGKTIHCTRENDRVNVLEKQLADLTEKTADYEDLRKTVETQASRIAGLYGVGGALATAFGYAFIRHIYG